MVAQHLCPSESLTPSSNADAGLRLLGGHDLFAPPPPARWLER